MKKKRKRRLFGLAAAFPAALAAAALALASDQGPAREPEVTAAEETEALEFVKENAPEMHGHLLLAKSVNPEAARGQLRGIAMGLRDKDIRPVLARNLKAGNRVQKTAERVRRSRDEAARRELEEALGEQFEAESEAQRTQLRKMERAIADIRKQAEERRREKDKIIRERLEGFLR